MKMAKWHHLLKKLGYLRNKEVFLKTPCFYFPLYQKCSIGIVIVDLALPSLSHIIKLFNNYLFMKLLFLLLGYVISIIITSTSDLQPSTAITNQLPGQ